MTTWTSDELDTIANADELRLSTQRPDGSLRNPGTIWAVRHGDDLYVRSYRGPGGSWFRHAREHREGRNQAGGADKDVTFADADQHLDDQIDTAYRGRPHAHIGRFCRRRARPGGAIRRPGPARRGAVMRPATPPRGHHDGDRPVLRVSAQLLVAAARLLRKVRVPKPRRTAPATPLVHHCQRVRVLGSAWIARY
jgi:hypothetical protein